MVDDPTPADIFRYDFMEKIDDVIEMSVSADFDQVILVNLKSAFVACRAAARPMDFATCVETKTPDFSPRSMTYFGRMRFERFSRAHHCCNI